MRVIIAGSRDISNYTLLQEAITSSGFIPTEVISGGAYGVDRLGEQYAKTNNLTLSVFRADWELFGKSAGPIRNKQMAQYAQALIALWDGVSRGTHDMIKQAIQNGLKIKVFLIVDDEIAEIRDFSPSPTLFKLAAEHNFDMPQLDRMAS